MTNFISKSEKIAYKYFKGYGFEDEEIFRLIDIGMRDVRLGLETLEGLLKEDESKYLENIYDILHGLKGLLAQLGNIEIIKEIEVLESSTDIDELRNKTNLLFFDII